MDNVASMAWNRHAIAQMELRKIVASMAWGARNLIPHGPRHELDVLRRRRVVDGRADGVRHGPEARIFGHFIFRRDASTGVSRRVFDRLETRRQRLERCWSCASPSARPKLGLLGCAWLSAANSGR